MECFILKFSGSRNYIFEQPVTINYSLCHYHRFSDEVSSNFVYILFLLSKSDFWRNSSSKRALRSWFQKLNYLRIKLAHWEIGNRVIYSFIQKLTNSLILEYSFHVRSWEPWNYSQDNKMRLFLIFFSKIQKIDYFRTK